MKNFLALILFLISSIALGATSNTNFPSLGVAGNGAAATATTAYTMVITGTSSNPTKGTTAVDLATYRRVGDTACIKWDYAQSAAGSAGSGTYLFSLPPGLSIDSTKQTIDPTNRQGYLGSGTTSNHANGASAFTADLNVYAYDTTHVYLMRVGTSGSNLINETTTIGSGAGDLNSNANQSFHFNFCVPIAGWTALSSVTGNPPRAQLRLSGGAGHGSTNNKIRVYTTVVENTGTAWTFSNSASLGASITIVEPGIYNIWRKDRSATSDQIGFSVNSSQLTTAIASITDANHLISTEATPDQFVSASFYFNAGDVIRPHGGGVSIVTGTSDIKMGITKVSN